MICFANRIHARLIVVISLSESCFPPYHQEDVPYPQDRPTNNIEMTPCFLVDWSSGEDAKKKRSVISSPVHNLLLTWSHIDRTMPVLALDKWRTECYRSDATLHKEDNVKVFFHSQQSTNVTKRLIENCNVFFCSYPIPRELITLDNDLIHPKQTKPMPSMIIFTRSRWAHTHTQRTSTDEEIID